jgi:hypothetical protein
MSEMRLKPESLSGGADGVAITLKTGFSSEGTYERNHHLSVELTTEGHSTIKVGVGGGCNGRHIARMQYVGREFARAQIQSAVEELQTRDGGVRRPWGSCDMV